MKKKRYATKLSVLKRELCEIETKIKKSVDKKLRKD